MQRKGGGITGEDGYIMTSSTHSDVYTIYSHFLRADFLSAKRKIYLPI